MRVNRPGLLFALVALALVAAGCRPGTPAPTATVSGPDAPASETPAGPASATPTPSRTPTATASQTPVPTDTAAPTHTPTETPAPTLPPDLTGVVSSEVLKLYTGPGQVYDSIGALGKGVNVRLVGIEEELLWALVDLGFEQTAWVSLGGLDVEGSPALLPRVPAPPAPTPTFTPIPPPRVTSFYRHQTGFYLSLSGLEPGESIFISVTHVDTGAVVATLTAAADSNGNIRGLYFRVDQSSSEFEGLYRIVIYGDGGWTLILTKTVQ